MNYRKKVILLTAALCCLNFAAYAQSISLKMKNVPVKKAMNELKDKSGYSFVYEAADVDTKKKVSVEATQLEDAIEQILQGQNLTYEMKGKNIIIKRIIASTPIDTKKRSVSGVVTDPNGEPIIGASVKERGTMNGVVTDMDGRFTLSIPDNGTLHVSYVGYADQNLSVAGKNSLQIQLMENTKVLDEVVIVGYTAQKKGLLTGSVVSMKMNENIEKMATTAAGNTLVGRLAGVNVSTPNGVPGAAPSISIRTSSSSNTQYVLYVIDGIVRGEGDFNNLSPNEIDDITILKDAASAAIYGSRSDGGVVLVTTKRGKQGKPTFNYSYSFGVDTRTNNVEQTDAIQTGEIYNRVYAGETRDWFWSKEEFDYIKTVNNGWGYDQLDIVWRNPTIQTHNLSVNGGSDKVKYFAGVSYVKQEGFLKPLNYDKFNFRLNTTVDVTENLQFFASMALTDNKQQNATYEGVGMYSKLLRWQPDQPIYTDSGELVDYSWTGSVGGEFDGHGGYSKNYFLKPQINLSVTYKIPKIEGLSLKAAYGSNWAYSRSTNFRKKYKLAVLQRDGQYQHIYRTDKVVGYRESSQIGKDYIEKSADWGYDYQMNFQVNYNKTFKDVHSIQGVLAYERSQQSGSGINAGSETFPVYLTDQFWAASSARADTWGGGATDWKLGRASFIGQFIYSYANKYIANFSFREDGSMKFAKNQRWGFFPAGSAAWVISEESFFNKEKINFLKLRVSAGLTGNDEVGSNWAWQESYSQGSSAYFGETPSRSVGIKYGSLVNPDFTWEKSFSYNVAVDMNFLKHWNMTAEYWHRKTFDILGQRNVSLPPTFSMTMPKVNYGKMQAQGFDLSLGYKNQWKDFEFYGNLTMSYGWNKVLEKDYALNTMAIDVPVGKSSNVIRSYLYDGIIRTQEQLDQFVKDNPNYNIGGKKPKLGSMLYKDLSGPDGKPDGNIDSWDRVILAANNFPINYGLNLGGNWKGISLDMMFTGKLKYKKSFKDLSTGVEWNRMWKEWYDNSWTPENPNAWLPQRVGADISYDKDSDFWMKDASFVRLKFVNIGYSLPQKWYKGAFDRVKIYFSGNNLFCLSKFSYYDPEIGGGWDFPVMRSFNFGIDVTF